MTYKTRNAELSQKYTFTNSNNDIQIQAKLTKNLKKRISNNNIRIRKSKNTNFFRILCQFRMYSYVVINISKCVFLTQFSISCFIRHSATPFCILCVGFIPHFNPTLCMQPLLKQIMKNVIWVL